jgi:hypothetical protein
MIGSRRGKLSLRDLRSVQPGQTIWDGSVSGFGARRQRGGVISYIVVYRTREGSQFTYIAAYPKAPVRSWPIDLAVLERRLV